MRIVVDYRPALRERTGVGEYIHQTARALVASAPPGESLTLFSSSWKDRLGADAVPGAEILDRRIPVGVLNRLWHRWSWPPVEALAGRAFDLANSPHPLLLPSRSAAQTVTIHDLDFLDHPERTRAEIRRDYPAYAHTHAQRADQVIVVSSHTASEVEQRFGIARSSISICPPGAPSWAAREREPRADGCILFLGTLEPRKNLEILVSAYETLAGSRAEVPPLVLAGRITDEAASLVARVSRSSVAHRVEFPGYIAPEERRRVYERALVFVLPSHTEGFGMPAVEAMMLGVPVVVANRGALPEVVGTAGRLIDPEDAGDLAQALSEILDHPDMRVRMALAGIQNARRFTWANTAARTREAWQLAVEHRRAR